MSISVVTFANLGIKHNLKTPDILPVVIALEQQGELRQIICQINSNFQFKETYQAIPSVLRRAIRLVERLTHIAFPRNFSERLFDYFAQRKLASSDSYLFHGGYFLPRTFKKAREAGSLLIDLAVVAHLGANASLEQEELCLLGVPEYRGTYTKLGEEVTHDNDFDYVIALSEFVKGTYVTSGFPEERIFVAHPDVDTRRFLPSLADEDSDIFRVVYMAYSTPLKGLHYLLEAWSSLSLPRADLVLVGGYGDMPLELKQRYAAQIEKDASITWVGSENAPEKHYQSASVFIFPSLTEGFGRVTLEAMACGVPVITTENARGIVEDGKTGFVVPIRNASALREKIEYLYTHRDVARAMGREARRVVEHKKPFGEATLDIYQEILRREGKI